VGIRKPFFGRIENKKMHLSDIGSIASQYWMDIPNHFAHIRLDEFVIMPNHLHGIIILDYFHTGSRHGVTLQSSHDYSVGPCHGMALPIPWHVPACPGNPGDSHQVLLFRRIYVCPICLKIAGFKPEDLIEGVQITQKDKFFSFTKGRILTMNY
jgi:hypothetical protein